MCIDTKLMKIKFWVKKQEIGIRNDISQNNVYALGHFPCLVGRKFSVFYIQTFRKQGKHV